MDQAALLTIIGSLYDKLVEDVATRVFAKLERDQLAELVRPIVESQMTAAIEAAMDEHHSNYDHEDFITDDDLESKIEGKVDEALNNLEIVTKSEVEEIVENTDLTEQVKDALKYNVSLSVSVD